MTLPYYAVGNTHKFRDTISKDGAVWDLTTATVYLVLVTPSGNELPAKVATIENAASGIAYYTTTTLDLNVPGLWRRYWRVTDVGGTIDLVDGMIAFTVNAR